VHIWDIRKFHTARKGKSPTPLSTQHAGKSVNSAFFSPSGSTLLSTTMSNTLELTKEAHLANEMNLKPTKRVRHDNHTGRWLCTFMAQWHPSMDIFVVGSMQKPRAIEIFDSEGQELRAVQGESLTAVASRCCFHPSEDRLILVGGNSSGRVTVVR
jgi:WD40 repeat protein